MAQTQITIDVAQLDNILSLAIVDGMEQAKQWGGKQPAVADREYHITRLKKNAWKRVMWGRVDV